MSRKLLVIIALVAFGVWWGYTHKHEIAQRLPSPADLPVKPFTTEVELIPHPKTTADKIVNGAKTEVNKGVFYDASYFKISYPNGDVPSDRGACTDVIIRSLRNAGYDLQKLIHEDMSERFGSYPHRYGLNKPDPSIDHRRIPNHLVFMKKYGKALPIRTDGEAAESWRPGDLIYWQFDNGLYHCGVLSNDLRPDGLPLVIHNIGSTRQGDYLNRWKIVAHFRYPAKNL